MGRVSRGCVPFVRESACCYEPASVRLAELRARGEVVALTAASFGFKH